MLDLTAKTIRICVLFETSEKRLNNFQTTHANMSNKEQENSCGQNVRKIPWTKCLEISCDATLRNSLNRMFRHSRALTVFIMQFESSELFGTEFESSKLCITEFESSELCVTEFFHDEVREFGTV